jgi:glutathione S-transferase
MTTPPLSWTELEALADLQFDTVNGPTNAQAQLRLFGRNESDVRVTLYRDNHAWCPYCQKIWLWLEEKQIPYRIEKVTMFCYGKKESWYKRIVPSGMLPAIELDGRIITESDDILIALEQVYEPLGLGMKHPRVLPLRQLERLLFRAWCAWLCYPTSSSRQEQANRAQFLEVVSKVEVALGATRSPYFLEEFGTVDVIFTPYVERMNASLYYYKGIPCVKKIRAYLTGLQQWKADQLTVVRKAIFILTSTIYRRKWGDVGKTANRKQESIKHESIADLGMAYLM